MQGSEALSISLVAVSGASLDHSYHIPFNTSFPMAPFSQVVIFKTARVDPARAAKAARVIRSIKGRYRAQAFLFLAYHFFLSSPLHLDVFVLFFILVSNFMNRNEAFPIQMLIDGVRFLLDERRFLMP